MTCSLTDRINLQKKINNLRFVILMYLIEVKLSHIEGGHYKREYKEIRLKHPEFNLPEANLSNLNDSSVVKPFFEIPRQLWSENAQKLNKEIFEGQYFCDHHRFIDYYKNDYDQFEKHRVEQAGLSYPFPHIDT